MAMKKEENEEESDWAGEGDRKRQYIYRGNLP